jgi:hypothetical protein
MFEKTQKAVTELSQAVSQDVASAITLAKAVVVPTVTEYLNKIAAAAQNTSQGVQDGSLFKTTEQAVKPVADPLPTEAQNDAIKVLRALGKTDEEIAKAVGVSVLTVKMCY